MEDFFDGKCVRIFIYENPSFNGCYVFFREASYYPISILPVFMQVFMTFVIPYSMINFFPIQIILPKNDFLFLNKDWIYLSPLFAVIFSH